MTLWTEKPTKISVYVLELQDTQSYVALVWLIESTQLESWAYTFIKRWRQFSLTVCNSLNTSMCRNWVLLFMWGQWINTISSFLPQGSVKTLNMDSTIRNTKTIHRLCCCLKINLAKVSKIRPDTKMNLWSSR